VLAVLHDSPLVPRPGALFPLEIRDSTDAWVLATAVNGQADVLVTGDADLLTVREHAPLAIMDPRAFWEPLRSSPGDS